MAPNPPPPPSDSDSVGDGMPASSFRCWKRLLCTLPTCWFEGGEADVPANAKSLIMDEEGQRQRQSTRIS